MKKISAVAFSMTFCVVLVSCSSTQKARTYDMANRQTAEMNHTGSYNDQLYNEEGNFNERIVVHSAFISLSVENIDSLNNHLERIAEVYNGYIAEMGTDLSIIRVKSEFLDDALDRIELLGKVKSRKRFGIDVTEEYEDYQIRLDNALKARERYLELLNKSENVQSALNVERELERLNETIDLLQGKINRLDHLSSYSTISVDIKLLQKPGLLGYIGIGFYSAVKWLFVRG